MRGRYCHMFIEVPKCAWCKYIYVHLSYERSLLQVTIFTMKSSRHVPRQMHIFSWNSQGDVLETIHMLIEIQMDTN